MNLQGAKRMIPARLIFRAIIFLLVFGNVSRAATEGEWVIPPVSLTDQTWRFTSFLEDGGLSARNIFFIDFEPDSTAWIAASDGLYRYDGYTWRRFTASDGLPSDFVRCVLVASDGRLWVGTDQGVAIFDGNAFTILGPEEGLAGPSIRRIIQTPDGAIWFCCDRWPDATVPGGLCRYSNGEWKVYDKKDGLPSDHVMNYFQDSKGREFALTFSGLAQRRGERWINPLERQGVPGSNQRFWSIAETADGDILAAADRAMFLLHQGEWRRIPYGSYREYSIICSTGDGAILAPHRTDQHHSYLSKWTGTDFEPVSGPIRSPEWYVQAIREAPDGSIWCVGFNFLVRWDTKDDEWTEYAGIYSPRLLDGAGRIWFVGARGAAWFDGERWEQVTPFHGSVELDEKGDVWGWSQDGVCLYSPDGVKSFSAREIGLERILGFDIDGEGRCWVYGLDSDRNNTVAVLEGTHWRWFIWPQLQGGRIVQSAPDPGSGVWYLVSGDVPSEFYLYRVDNMGVRQQSLDPRIRKIGVPPGLYIDSRGDLWVYGTIGLYRLMQDRSSSWEQIKQIPGKNVFLCVERDGEMWFGVDPAIGGRGGLVVFRDGEWRSFDVAVRGFGVCAWDGTILFGGYGKLYIIPPGSHGPPLELTVPGSKKVFSAVIDPAGDLWMGCGGSVLRYRPDGVPPETLITRMQTEIRLGGTLKLELKAIERFVPLSAAKAFRFSWRIDQEPWTEFMDFPAGGLPAEALSSGQHVLQVRAQDEGGDVDPTPTEHAFFVYPVPLQERIWFRPAVAAVFLLIVGLAMAALAAKWKATLYARQLEEIVDARTAALRASEQSYRELFENANDIVYTHDLSGRIISMNKAAEKVAGYSREESAGKNIAEFVAPEYLQLARNMIERKLAGEETTTYELEIIARDGRRVPLEVSTRLIKQDGKPVAVQGIARDIAERKQVEQALEKSEQVYRSAIEVAGAVPYYQDYSTHTYQFVGPGIESLVGYPPGEFTCEVWESITEEIILLGDLAGLPLEEAVRKARGAEGVSWRADYRVRTRNGEERWIANAAVQVRDDSGAVVGSLGILQDITDRKRLEDQLRQAHKMEAVGQLAGGVAHDFNNLLTGIIGNLRLAQRKRHVDKIGKYLVRAEEAAERAAGLVQQLLAFSRESRMELRPVDLNEVVREAHAFARELIDRRIEIVVQAEENIPRVMADASQINSVLVNLCVNARDAINDILEGKTLPERRNDRFIITIQTSPVEIDRRYCETHSEASMGQFVVLSVSDNGTGMDEQTRRRIFEPFFTTKEVGKGTGLGLASAYGIVKQHNGWITVDSEPVRGTTFRIYLPVAKKGEQGDQEKKEEDALGGTETILLVDDEEMILETARTILESYGYTVLTACDGREGLDLYMKESDRIKIVILDVSMPHLSGREMLERLKSLNRGVKVLVSSGYPGKEHAHDLEGLGAVAYVSKPYRPADLARKVREVLDGAHEAGV